MVYRKLSVPTLVGLLGRCAANLLIIGLKHSFIVNARTAANSQYCGTVQAIGLTKKATNQRMWLRLEHMALRFASAGCAIKVHCLHNRRPGDGPLFELMKTEDALF